jgi:signal peptidase II
MFKKLLSSSLIYWIAGGVILLDQYLKFVVRSTLAVGESWEPLPGFGPYVRLLHIENNGAAFGMFQQGGLLFTVIAIVVSAVILYYSTRLPEGQWMLRVALGLQLGGALGNLIDRLLRGPVTDFFNLLSVINTPIFNVADLSITTGVIVLLLLMWRDSRHRTAAPPEPADASEAS